MALTARDQAILDLERSWWADGRPKEALIEERLALSAARYQARLRALVDLPAALDYDPLVVHRLRRQRDGRRRGAPLPPVGSAQAAARPDLDGDGR